MLGWLQDSAKSGILKYFLMGLLLLAGAGLVLTDVGGFFRGGVPVDSVATVEGQKITLDAYDREVRNSLFQEDLIPQEALGTGRLEQILDRMIAQKLLRQMAHDNDIAVPRDALIEEIRQYAQSYAGSSGVPISEAFKQMLRNQGITEKAFLEMLKQEKLISVLSEIIQNNVIVPSVLAQDFVLASGQARAIEALVIEKKDMEAELEPSEAVLTAHYETIKNRFMTAERRSFDVLVLSEAAIGETLSVSDEQIESFYESNIDQYTKATARKIAQYRSRDEIEARAVYKAATSDRAAVTLEDAVREATGSTSGLIEADWYDQGGLAADLSEAVFNAEMDSIVGPVESPLGWHVLHVQEERGEEQIPLKDVRDDIRETLEREALLDSFYETSIEVEEALDMGSTAKDVGSTFSLPVNSFASVAADGSGPDGNSVLDGVIEDQAIVIEEAFRLAPFETSFLLEGESGKFYAVTVTDKTESRFRPFEVVQDQVKKDWIEEQKRIAAEGLAASLQTDLVNSENPDFRKAAQENMAVDYDIQPRLQRQASGSIPYLNGQAIGRIFASEPGDIIMLEGVFGYAIIHVKDIVLPDGLDYGEQEITRAGQLINQLLQGIQVQTFIQALQERYDVQRNPRAIEFLYNPDARR